MQLKAECAQSPYAKEKEDNVIWVGQPVCRSSALLQNRPLFQFIYPGYLWARDKRWLLSRVQRLVGPAGGQGPFVPGGATNPDKRPPFCHGWWLHPGQKAQPFYPGW